MNHQESQLKRIHDKMLLLVKQHYILQRENEKLKEDLKKSQLRIEQISGEAEKFRREIDALRLTGNAMDEPEKKNLEKRLSHYVREIDRCIALLHE
jgi:hypothetical protein